jgi:hypothetical protein
MGLINQEEAMGILGPHISALRAIPLDAWDEYHAEMPESLLVTFCSRTRASAVHNLMVRNAAKYASSTDGVRLFERNKMVGITIDGRLAIRFKKLDEESLSRNQPSQQVDDFRGQQILDGIDATHNLELGYVLNEEETEVLEVRIAHPTGQGVYWWATLNNEGESGGTIALFTPPAGPEPQPPRIEPKKPDNVIPLRKKDDEN